MCIVDPEQRITAADSLKHQFFTEIEDHEMIIESTEEDRFKEYHEQKNQIFVNKGFEANSLIIRNPVINGRMDTIKDSVNS